MSCSSHADSSEEFLQCLSCVLVEKLWGETGVVGYSPGMYARSRSFCGLSAARILDQETRVRAHPAGWQAGLEVRRGERELGMMAVSKKEQV